MTMKTASISHPAHSLSSFFESSLSVSDALVFEMIENERHRQRDQIELIASENIVSRAVLQAQGSVMTNKYAEGYAGRRYYGGCECVDQVERLAIHRAKQLFGCAFANVQPHSGSQANQAVFLSLMTPGDCFLGLSLNAGGHLTHGSQVNLSGKWFKPVGYQVDPKTHLIDYEEVQKLAEEHRPKIIIAGGSAYPRSIDFKKFREIADSVGAYLMVDMAHFAGLVAGGQYPSPFPYAHIVTSTTHKTLRGPRGGLILTNDEALAKKIDGAIFPGLQGGPLMHVIAAKAVAFGEALHPSFKDYTKAVVQNTKAMGQVLQKAGFELVSGGTDSHLILVDLRPFNVFGKDVEKSLEDVHITCNKNGIPYDTTPPTITSGIRLGAAACSTRGFGIEEFKTVGSIIATAVSSMKEGTFETMKGSLKEQSLALLSKFPIYNQA